MLAGIVAAATVWLAWPGDAGAAPITIVSNEVTTQATVVTRTNNKGYNVVFWNFQLPATFTGSGTANTVTDLSFLFFQNSPQGGNGALPLNIAIYDGFFTPGKYSTTAGSTLYQPIGNSYSTPVNSGTTPLGGLDTVQSANTGSGQLNMGTFTPAVNAPYGSHTFEIPTTQTPFNGTSPNASGQYSLVIWTESTQNYQWKSGGQLDIQIPGVTGIQSSVTPGYLDGINEVTTSAGALAPVPEPSTYCMAIAGIAYGGISMWRRRKRA